MISDKSLDELAGLLEKKEISSAELTEQYLDRTEKLNPSINAFISVNRESAMKAARESDERRACGQPLSPWDGIPVALKDNICVKNFPVTCASKILENYTAPYDSGAWERLAAKGFIMTGKTNMDEFAMGSTSESSYFGPVKNPYDLSRVPGGSSGGSAAAVAAGMVPAALGSDTGGSIRQPASFCGVTGVKPTYGRVSRYGLVAFASSLDQIGSFGRTVRDSAVVLDAVCGLDRRDSTSIDRPLDILSADSDVKGLRIGIPDEYFQGINPGVSSVIMEKVSALEKKGALVKKVSLKYTEYAIPVYYLIATAEASSNLARFDGVRYGFRSGEAENLESLYVLSRSQGFGREVKRRIMLGTFALSSGYYDAYYLKALKGRQLLINDFKRVFEDTDVIISPVATSVAPHLGAMTDDPLEMYMSDILTISANLAGIPGISVPGGMADGMPVGVQIMANHFMERDLFRAALAVEENSDISRPQI